MTTTTTTTDGFVSTTKAAATATAAATIVEDLAIFSSVTGILDVGELIAQSFWLQLDPFPKKPGTRPVQMEQDNNEKNNSNIFIALLVRSTIHYSPVVK